MIPASRPFIITTKTKIDTKTMTQTNDYRQLALSPNNFFTHLQIMRKKDKDKDDYKEKDKAIFFTLAGSSS